jgi:hypothetical protein
MSKNHQKKFLPLKDEIYQLLLCTYCYIHKLENLDERIKKNSRYFLLEEMTALRLMSNGIILKICSLDESGSGKWTLQTLKKEVFSGSTEESKKKKINKMLKKFRQDINHLKTKHRNKYIAHRAIDEYPDMLSLDYRDLLIPIVKDVVDIFELLWDDKVSFGFRLGSLEGTIDFKNHLGIN